MNNKRTYRKKPKWKLLHQYYSYTGFYNFLGKSIVKALPPAIIFIMILLCIHFFVMDIHSMLDYMITEFPDYAIFSIFFTSESLFGLIPPEIFIAWSGKAETPLIYLTILAFLSYFGGIISYFIGISISLIPSVLRYLENGAMAKNIKNMRKWGGLLIIVGALLPLPFSISSMAAGIIKYPFNAYILLGLLRILRFAFYGFAIFNML